MLSLVDVCCLNVFCFRFDETVRTAAKYSRYMLDRYLVATLREQSLPRYLEKEPTGTPPSFQRFITPHARTCQSIAGDYYRVDDTDIYESTRN